jgi:hypothetical protein
MFSYLGALVAVVIGEIENCITSVFRPKAVYNPGPHHFEPMNLPNGAFSPDFQRPAVLVAAENTSEYNPGLPPTDVTDNLTKMKTGLDIMNNSPLIKTQSEGVIINGEF